MLVSKNLHQLRFSAKIPSANKNKLINKTPGQYRFTVLFPTKGNVNHGTIMISGIKIHLFYKIKSALFFLTFPLLEEK